MGLTLSRGETVYTVRGVFPGKDCLALLPEPHSLVYRRGNCLPSGKPGRTPPPGRRNSASRRACPHRTGRLWPAAAAFLARLLALAAAAPLRRGCWPRRCGGRSGGRHSGGGMPSGFCPAAGGGAGPACAAGPLARLAYPLPVERFCLVGPAGAAAAGNRAPPGWPPPAWGRDLPVKTGPAGPGRAGCVSDRSVRGCCAAACAVQTG